MGGLVYFSSRSENTHRFVQKLGLAAVRLPVDASEEPPEVDAPFVLVLPTYGGGGEKGAVPKPVIRFLNNPHNRSLIRGVIAAGNTNFGTGYATAGNIIAMRLQNAHDTGPDRTKTRDRDAQRIAHKKIVRIFSY